jgi:hypothetical protein
MLRSKEFDENIAHFLSGCSGIQNSSSSHEWGTLSHTAPSGTIESMPRLSDSANLFCESAPDLERRHAVQKHWTKVPIAILRNRSADWIRKSGLTNEVAVLDM